MEWRNALRLLRPSAARRSLGLDLSDPLAAANCGEASKKAAAQAGNIAIRCARTASPRPARLISAACVCLAGNGARVHREAELLLNRRPAGPNGRSDNMMTSAALGERTYDFLCVDDFLATELDARAIKSAFELGIVDALVGQAATTPAAPTTARSSNSPDHRA